MLPSNMADFHMPARGQVHDMGMTPTASAGDQSQIKLKQLFGVSRPIIYTYTHTHTHIYILFIYQLAAVSMYSMFLSYYVLRTCFQASFSHPERDTACQTFILLVHMSVAQTIN